MLWSTLVTIGRDIEISGPSLIGAGARRFTTFATPGLDLSGDDTRKQFVLNSKSNEMPIYSLITFVLIEFLGFHPFFVCSRTI